MFSLEEKSQQAFGELNHVYIWIFIIQEIPESSNLSFTIFKIHECLQKSQIK